MPSLPLRDLEHIYNHTKGLWEELRGQKIFITGGTGFIGCWMLESFMWANEKLKLGSKAIVLTRYPDEFAVKVKHIAENPSIELFQGDVRSFIFPPSKCSHIIHMANERDDSDSLLLLDTIINGTWGTLNFANYCGAKKFLFMSSGAVYNSRSHVLAPYAEGKRIAELLCFLYKGQYGLETKIARGFNFVGAYLPLEKNYAIGNFVSDALNKRTIHVRGDGTPCRSYLYMADAVIWLWTILFRGEGIYDVGSEREISIAQLAEMVSETVSPPLPIEIEGNKDDSLKRYVPSTRKAFEELGLRQYIDLEEAIKRTREWYENGNS